MAGGNLRCFTKVRCLSEASSNFWKTVLAEFRQPRSQPPTKPQPEPMHTPRRPIHVLYLHPPTIYHKIKTKTQRRNPHVHHRPGIRDVPSPRLHPTLLRQRRPLPQPQTRIRHPKIQRPRTGSPPHDRMPQSLRPGNQRHQTILRMVQPGKQHLPEPQRTLRDKKKSRRTGNPTTQ